ncbi:hypothetical protein D3C87_1425170 [compost metagenome]
MVQLGTRGCSNPDAHSQPSERAGVVRYILLFQTVEDKLRHHRGTVTVGVRHDDANLLSAITSHQI